MAEVPLTNGKLPQKPPSGAHKWLAGLSATHGRNPVELKLTFWLAGIFLLTFSYFLPRGDWGADARLDTALAIVNQQTLAIDPYRWNTGDVSLDHGHYYSLRSPGQSLAAVPVVALGVLAVKGSAGNKVALSIGKDKSHNLFLYVLLLYMSSLVLTALPSVLFLLLFFKFLGYFTQSLPARLTLTLSIGLATPVFSYAQVFYAHVPAAGLLLAGFVPLYLLRHPDRAWSERTRWLTAHVREASLLVGLSLGLAFLVEYQTLLIVLMCLAFALVYVGRGSALFILFGLLPGAAVSILCSELMYASPSFLAFAQHSVHFHGNAQGLAGFRWPPTWSALWGLSLSPYRGLFFVSPFLLLAIPGFAVWWKQRKDERPDVAVCAIIPVVYFVFLATYAYWDEGSSVGPRYFLPALPFLAAPIGFLLSQRRRRVWAWSLAFLAVLSLLNVWAQTLGRSVGYPPTGQMDPLFSFALPSLARGDGAWSIGFALLLPLAGHRPIVGILLLPVLLVLWTLYVFRRSVMDWLRLSSRSWRIWTTRALP